MAETGISLHTLNQLLIGGSAKPGDLPKQVIKTDEAPKPAGSYSQGTVAQNFVFVAGQVGTDPKTGILPGGITEQTRQTLASLAPFSKLGNINPCAADGIIGCQGD